jgi:hypothetical protein
MGVDGQRHAPAASPPGNISGAHFTWASWAPGPVWSCAVGLASTGIRSPDRPARSESLYRLSYPGPLFYTAHSFSRHGVAAAKLPLERLGSVIPISKTFTVGSTFIG